MDLTTLAPNLVTFLAPFLPYLLKAGEKAVEEVSEKFGAEAWERAKTLWGTLRGKPDIESAAQDVAAMPDDPDAQAALRLQLKKLLAADEALAAELARLWQEAEAAGVTVIASGERSVAVGSGVTGSTIIIGDGNVVGDHSRSQVEKWRYHTPHRPHLRCSYD